MGCNFQSETLTKETNFYSTCKLGLLTTFAINNVDHSTTINTGLFGLTGDTVFFVSINVTEVTYSRLKSSPSNLSIMRLNNNIIIGRVITTNDHDLVILIRPFSDIHTAKRVGRLSFIKP